MLLLSGPIFSQPETTETRQFESFPDLLSEPSEILPSSKIPGGTFVRIKDDFIVCTGPDFQGEPPGGPDSAGAVNNRLVKEVLANLYDRGHTEANFSAQLSGWQTALKDDPQFFPFLYNLGKLLLLVNLPERGLRYLQSARQRAPEFSGVYLLLGRTYQALSEHASAVANFRLAHQKNPLKPDALLALGDYYLETEAFPQAQDAYRRILKLFPEYPNAWIGLGRLSLIRRDPLQARENFRSVNTKNSDGSERTDFDRSLFYYMAEASVSLKDYRDALVNYDRLLENPRDPFFVNVLPLSAVIKRRTVIQRLAEEQR